MINLYQDIDYDHLILLWMSMLESLFKTWSMKCFLYYLSWNSFVCNAGSHYKVIFWAFRYKLICTKYSIHSPTISFRGIILHFSDIHSADEKGGEVGGTNCAKHWPWILSLRRGQLKQEKRLKICLSLKGARWALFYLWIKTFKICHTQVGRGTYGHVYKAKRKDGWVVKPSC